MREIWKMTVEAPLNQHRKSNLLIYIGICAVFAGWLGYDGYFNEGFRQRHTDADGKADASLVFNQKAAPVLACAAVLLAGYLLAIRNRKIIADDKELVISDKERISYDSIQRINKTDFESKGSFVLTYRDDEGKEIDRKLSNRDYDNLAAILDKLVAEIS